MFLLVCLISGPAGAGSGEDSPSYVLQVHKVKKGGGWEQFLLLILVSLSRRDVNFTCFCHVATWTSHVVTSIFTFSVTSRLVFSRRDVNLYKPLSRRDVAPHVATSFNNILFHVATLSRTSRCWLSYSLSRRDVTPHVTTWPCFKPKISSVLAFHLTHSKSKP